MSSPTTVDKLARLRSYLEHFERTPNPGDDAETIESLKHLLLNQIRALEIALAQACAPPEAPPE